MGKSIQQNGSDDGIVDVLGEALNEVVELSTDTLIFQPSGGRLLQELCRLLLDESCARDGCLRRLL